MTEGGPAEEGVQDEGDHPHAERVDEREDENGADQPPIDLGVPPDSGADESQVEHRSEVAGEDAADVAPDRQYGWEEGENPRRGVELFPQEGYEAAREEARYIEGEGDEGLD